jgi:hypothetical protein
MKQILIAAAIAAGVSVAGIGLATIVTDFRPETKAIASKLAPAVVRGIILGANVGPYQSPAHIESRVTASGYAPAQTTNDWYSIAGD